MNTMLKYFTIASLFLFMNTHPMLQQTRDVARHRVIEKLLVLGGLAIFNIGGAFGSDELLVSGVLAFGAGVTLSYCGSADQHCENSIDNEDYNSQFHIGSEV